MKEIVVTVSTRHYKKSAGFSSNYACPLALALKESTGREPSVGGYYVHFDDDIAINYRIPTAEWGDPEEINKNIKRAKKGKEIEDVTLTLVEITSMKLL